MKRSMRLLLLAGVLVLGMVVAANAADFVFKLGHIADPENPYAKGAEKFAQLVKEKTGGKVEVQVFPSSQLGNQRDLVEGTQFGTIDFTMTSTAVLGNFLPQAAVFDLPFIFRDVQHAYKALDTVGMEIAEKLQGMKLLAYYENGVRHMTNSKRPIRKPEDMKGLKIRVMEQPIYIEMIKALGGNPTPMAFGELFTALQQGVVDGQENPVGTIYDLKLYETQKYMSILNYTYSSMVHVVNKKSWDKLTPDQQKILAEESASAAKFARKTLRDNEAVQLKDLETTKAIVVARPDLGPWKAAMGPAWDKVKTRVGPDNFKRFMDLVEKNSK